MERFTLEGKTAVVIGGSGTLGSAITTGFAEAGANVAVTYRNTPVDPLIQKLEKAEVVAKSYYMDVREFTSVTKCSDAICRDFDSVDVLVNLAGGNIRKAMTSQERSFFDLPMDALEEVVRFNLFGGAIVPAQVFGRLMLKNRSGGSIINTASMNTFRPLLARPGYAAAKSAVGSFTQWLAVHIAKECGKQIRVNAIAPGFFLNRRNRTHLVDDNGTYTERGAAIISHTPMGRFGDPDDLVGAAIWLASDASRFVTGTVIPIDGGFHAFSGV